MKSGLPGVPAYIHTTITKHVRTYIYYIQKQTRKEKKPIGSFPLPLTPSHAPTWGVGDAMQIDKRKQNKTKDRKFRGDGLGAKASQQPAASS